MKNRQTPFSSNDFLVFPLYVTADSGNTSTGNTGETSLYQRRDNVGRPNAPPRVTIECIYGEGCLSIVIPEGVMCISVKVYNDTEEYFGFVTTEDATMTLPILIGEYNIECTTDDGRVFCGVITW